MFSRRYNLLITMTALWGRSVAWTLARTASQTTIQLRGGSSSAPSSTRLYSSAPIVSSQELAAITKPEPLHSFGGLNYQRTDAGSRFSVVFVLGGPGAGKGTQSALLQEHYPCVHLSVGELLRNVSNDNKHSDFIHQALVQGRIVPVEISLELLQQAMKDAQQQVGDSTIFLVDGFPRNFDNLSGWCRIMAECSRMWGVLYYQCPLEELERRILERAKDSGRSDDNLESVKKRFRTFESETLPVIELMRKAAREACATWTVLDIRGDRPLDEVWMSTQQVLNQLILHDVLTCNAGLLEAVETGDVDAYQKLCDPGWFEGKDPSQVMREQEGEPQSVGTIADAQLDVISGKHVAVSYNRMMEGELMREKRVWMHDHGWRNIHFSRTPLSSS